MGIAKISGTNKEVEYHDGVFRVDGKDVSSATIAEYDGLDLIEWSSPEKKEALYSAGVFKPASKEGPSVSATPLAQSSASNGTTANRFNANIFGLTGALCLLFGGILFFFWGFGVEFSGDFYTMVFTAVTRGFGLLLLGLGAFGLSWFTPPR